MAAQNVKAKRTQGAAKKPVAKKAAASRTSVGKKTGPSQAARQAKKTANKTVRTSPSPTRIAKNKISMTPASSSQKISKQERDRLKQILLAIKERLTGQVTALKVDALKRDDGVNSAEDGTDAFDRQFALAIASSENNDLVEIDEALRRLEDGSYGMCEECGATIGSPRLKALPFTRKCVECQSKTENGRAHLRAAAMLDRS